MVTPDEEYDQYAKDPRTTCKFGSSCYQRNPLHHQKYKHPPKKRQSEEVLTELPSKKVKNVEENEPAPNSETPSSSDGTNESLPESLNHRDVDKWKEFIKEKFLVEMPSDFYSFWEFCKSINQNEPSNALKASGLELVGPYDVLSGKLLTCDKSPEDYLIHWRYYHDPPEFQTVIKVNTSSDFHIGYFRDDPSQLPVFLAGNHAKNNGEFTCMGDNIYAAVWQQLATFKKSCDPFKKLSTEKLQAKLKAHTENLKLSLEMKTDRIAERNKKIVVRTFNSIGLVVPYDRKTQVGYRHLTVSNAQLKKLLDRVVKASPQQRDNVMSELQPVLTNTSIAVDECDFGTGIELGWDILAHEVESLNSTIARFLSTNYELLDRHVFAKIIRAHMENRRRGTDLSIV